MRSENPPNRSPQITRRGHPAPSPDSGPWRRGTRWWIACGIGFALALAGCGGGEPLSPEAQTGKALFAERVIAPNPGCITCHSLDAGARLTGPSMAGIASRAGTREAGVSAEDYLRKSILSPDAFVVDGFDDDLMPENWGDVLSDEDVDALVSYLLTLDDA